MHAFRTRPRASLFASVQAVVLAVALLLLTAASAWADDLPTSPPQGWWWYYGKTPAEVTALLTANHARLTGIQVENTAPLRLTVTMVENTGAYAKTWWWFFGQSAADINAHAQALNARVVNIDPYFVNGNLFFAAIFIHNTGADAKPWWWFFGQTPSQIGSLTQQHHARLIDLRSYGSGAATRYAVAMEENTGTGASPWWWYFNVTPAQLSTNLNTNNAYLVSLQMADPASGRLNAIMDRRPTPGGHGWWWWYGQTANQLSALYTQDAAWIRDLKTYEVNGHRRFTALMLGTGAVHDEWYTFRYNALRTGVQPYASALSDPTKVPGLKVKWGFPSRGGVEAFRASPIVVHNTVFVGSTNGVLYAIDALTGALKWQYPAVGQPPLQGTCLLGDNGSFGHYGIRSSATYANIGGKEAVIFGAPDAAAEGGHGSGRLYALSLTGSLIWKSDVVAHLSGCTPGSATELHERITYSSPAVLGQMVYVGIHDAGDNPIQNGRLAAVDLNTGHLVPGFHYVSTATRGGGVWNSPANDGTAVYITTGNTRCDSLGCQSPEPNPNHGLSMLRLDRNTGGIVWGFQPVPYAQDNDPDWAAGTAVSPTSCGELVASVQKDGWTYAVDAGDGSSGAPALHWQFPPTGVPTPQGVDGHGDTDYKRPGAFWNDVLVIVTGGEARAHDNFGIGYGRLHALNACAGNEHQRVRWLTNQTDLPHNSRGGYALGAASVTGGIVYIGTDQGHLLALADPSVAPPIGYQCADVDYTTAAACSAAGSELVPVPKLLADVAMPDGGDIAGLRNEPALARGRVFVGTLNGHIYMLQP